VLVFRPTGIMGQREISFDPFFARLRRGRADGEREVG